MSLRFTLSLPASQDLDDILSYVLEHSGEQRAEHVARGFYEAFQKLADNPGLGHRREDLTQSEVLFFSVWSWLVNYKPHKTSLEVVRVVHAARDVEVLFRGRPF